MIEGKQLDINIRQNLRNFFLEEVIGTCPYIGTGKDRKNCLLILDQNTSKVLDKFMGVIDLIEGGIIGIERLDCIRKQFKQFHAIYFIEPSNDSLTKVINDFKDKKTNDDGQLTEQGPLYDFCHIIFNGPISNEQLARLANHKNLVYALLSIRQVFLDLEVIDENLFNLNIQNEIDFFLNFDQKNQDNLDLLTNKTLSIFTLLKKVESLQIIYEKNGPAQLLGTNLKDKAQKMIDVICKNKISQQTYPPIYLVIVNRGFDLLTPLMRNFTYGGLYYDIMKMKKAILEFEVDQDGQKVKQTSTLNEQDAIWLNYKYENFNKALKEIVSNYNEFLKKNFGQQDENEDAIENMQRLPELQEFLKDFNKHIGNLKKIKQIIQDQNFVEVFNFEQGLSTQRKLDGSDFLENDIDFSKITVSEDRIRLALLAKFSLDLETIHIKDKYLQNENEKKIFEEIYKNMLIFQQKQKDYLKGQEKIKEGDIQYYIPRANQVIEDLIKNQLFSKSEFKDQFNHYEIYSKNSNTKLFEQNLFEKKQGIFDQKDNQPIIVYLVLGGLSINEQICLNQLKENSQNSQFKLIFGGTSTNTSFQFIDKLSPQIQTEEQENFLSKQDIEIVDKNTDTNSNSQQQQSQDNKNDDKNKDNEVDDDDEDDDDDDDEDEF